MLRHGLISCGLVLVGCGGDDGGGDPAKCPTSGGENCFLLPTEAMVAHPAPMMSAAPVLGCGALVPVSSTHAVTVSGMVIDYQRPTVGVANVTLALFGSSELSGTPIATVTSGSTGAYSLTLPTGTPDILYGHETSPTTVELIAYLIDLDLTPATVTGLNFVSAAPAFIDTVYGLVRVIAETGTSFSATVTRDCVGFPLEHAEVTLSSQSGKRSFVPGTSVFYTASGTFPVPVILDIRGDSNDNGAVAILNVPAGMTYVQAWGFVDAAAVAKGADGLTLVAEHQVNFVAGAGLTINLLANR